MFEMSEFEQIFSRIENWSARVDSLERIVGEWLYTYFKEHSEVEDMCEEYFNGDREDEAHKQRIRDANQLLFEKYWCNQSEYYKPNWFSNIRLYTWEKVSHIEVLQNHDPDNCVIMCKYIYDGVPYGLLLRLIDNSLFVEHSFDQ
ncbi:hypothetical protein PRUB_a3835 [Pseudoalteromonas rubra]|uniref:Uncharacterized protein n=1 Tax=Pseudoalteromonas rubra TaxID=43658 RepID=A0A8T0CAH8_9GAMM|nr:hypothetical protein [Pseudoalteromonas rubra]KAF7786995.1 hypothetical protein PRUB_a3835 [Pseudoalteromonas rubra]